MTRKQLSVSAKDSANIVSIIYLAFYTPLSTFCTGSKVD